MKKEILKNKRNRPLTGFTIIELIVVIAIISILATIVSANVIKYISKAKDSSIKAQMEQIRTAAVDYISTSTDGYTGLCGVDTQCDKLKSNINSNFGGSIGQYRIASSTYCISYKLNDGSYWCVDNTGYSGLGNDNSCKLPSNYICTGS